MCRLELAAKEAAIARFLHEYPQAVDAGRGHPALRGCEEVRWSAFSGCPAGIPVLLYGLLDRAAAAEARRVLTDTMFDIAEMNPAVPEVLPFLLRLVSDPQLAEPAEPLRLLVAAAQFSEPVDEGEEAMVRWFGSDSEHPERERCRAVFADHASVVAALPDGLISADGRARLRRAAGLP